MPYYHALGEIPRTRHIRFRRPDGAFYSEEVFGTEGFVGPTSTLYHIHPPTQVTGWESMYSTRVEYVERDVMRMRHLKTAPMQVGETVRIRYRFVSPELTDQVELRVWVEAVSGPGLRVATRSARIRLNPPRAPEQPYGLIEELFEVRR